MADLNARIIAKASGTASEVPQASDLEVAELAVNTADAKLFTKHTDGSVVEIASGGGGGAVASVNGETGVVSLGVQDLDDFGLNAATVPTYDWDFGSNSVSGNASAGSINGSNTLFVNRTDRNGVTFDETALLATGTLYASTDNSTWYNASYSFDASFSNADRVAIDTDAHVGTNFGGGSDLVIYLSFNVDPDNPPGAPLADGDILQWVAADSKFKPVAFTAASVDSVNGETGIVSLGIQEMDDFQLATADGPSYVFDINDTSATPPAGTCTNYSTSYFAFNVVDQYGIDWESDWYNNATNGLACTVYINGTLTATTTFLGPDNKNQDRITSSFGDTTWISSLADGDVIQITSSAFTAVNQPLAEGDVLRWNSTDSKFTSGEFPQHVDAVSSVNTQTGVVSLGFEDMDDYELRTNTDYREWTYSSTNTGSPSTGGIASVSGGSQWAVNVTDANGNNWETELYAIASTTPYEVPVYINGALVYTDPDILGWDNKNNSRITFSFSSTTWTSGLSDGDTIGLGIPVLTYQEALADGNILQWDNADSKFRPVAFTAASVRTLLGIEEYVDDTAAGTGGVASGALYYNTTSSDYRLKS